VSPELSAAELNRYGYILAMRVMQSDLILDDAELAAMMAFLTPENSKAAIMGGEGSGRD